MPAATPLSSVALISGAASCAPSVALCALSTPRSPNQPWILSSAWFVFAEMSPDWADMPPKTRQKISTPMATRPSRTRIAPPMRGTLWRSSQPTAGPATAPSTAARITGMTIVEVSASSQISPTMTSTKPTSSQDEKPRFLSHVEPRTEHRTQTPSLSTRSRETANRHQARILGGPARSRITPTGVTSTRRSSDAGDAQSPLGRRLRSTSRGVRCNATSCPMPDRPHEGLITYDAKDPDTSFPPIEPLRPPEGAPNVLVILLDDVGFGASSAFGGPCATPDRGAARRERPEVQPLPHDRAVLADPPGAADRAQPPLRRHGRHHRDRHVRAGVQLDPPEHRGAAGRDAQAQRLLHGAVRQVPRGAGLGDEPAGAVRRLAERRRRVRALLRLHRRRDQPVRAGAVRRHGSDRAGPHPGGGLPPHRGHDRPGDRLGPPAEGADGGQAVLRLFRARRHARAAPRADRVVGQVQGPLRRGLGRASRGDVRAPEGARRDPARGRADRPARRDPGLGGHARRPQAGARASDGGVRRLPRAHRPSRRPARSTRSRTSRSSTTR